VTPELFKVLLVEDDEDDYFLTRSLFSEIKGATKSIGNPLSTPAWKRWLATNTMSVW
jgi:hypothetical protein